ncbi:alpha-tocopherol transfer protein-like [Lycorma delicatula]|uniref:alpha-tocopherol transfer protein-like n=1 Tax=Lycorma delicatula TaxID=130591 RepID=UPI003F5142C4
MRNCPTYVDKIVNMFKMFMKEKMRNRFHIHTSYQTLYNYMPQSILPEEYGGDAKSIHQLQDQ